MGRTALKAPTEDGARMLEDDSVWSEATDLPFKELGSIDIERRVELFLSAASEEAPQDSGKVDVAPHPGEMWKSLRGSLVLGAWSQDAKPLLVNQELGIRPLWGSDLADLCFPSHGFSSGQGAPMKLGTLNWHMPKALFGAPDRPRVSMTSHSANPEQIKTLVHRASTNLGRKLTAYLTDMSSVGAVDELSRGERTMSIESLECLKVAVRAADVVSDYNGRSAAQAWLQGKNRYLGKAPARYLREKGASAGGSEVLSAARAFITGA
jgi:hypothetical protein